MVETMYAAPGVGLAAPQIGLSQRVIVLDVDHENKGKQLLKLVNPVIAEREGEILWEEGCLSVRDYQAEVLRAERVLVRALDDRSEGDRDRGHGSSRSRCSTRSTT